MIVEFALRVFNDRGYTPEVLFQHDGVTGKNHLGEVVDRPLR